VYVIVRAPRKDKPLLLAAAFLNLPLSPLTYYFVRTPLDRLIGKLLGAYPHVFLFVKTFYAPLTEEPAKLWPLLIPLIVRRVTRENVARVALALGVGFGIGEIWLLAPMVATNAEYAAYPWYYFGGFIGERFMVCLLHGAFTAAVLWRLRRGFVLGLLTAMALHYVGNFPIYLAAIDLFGLSNMAWQYILSLWVVAYFLIMLTILAFFAYGKLQPGRIFFGLAQCPDCGVLYPRPFWGLNLGFQRYEKCPACKKWHKTREYKGPLESEDGTRIPVYGNEEENGARRRK
jgi:hypothetical protein